MFRRVILENWMSIFPCVAFVTAVWIYGLISLKALRMRPAETKRFENLPFDAPEKIRDEKQS